MHGHHANAVTLAFHLALDFKVVGFHPRQKAGQTGHARAFVGERLRQQGIDPVFCLWPQPSQQIAPPIVPDQDALDQVIGAQKIRFAAQVIQYRQGSSVVRIAQSLPQKAVFGAMMGQREQVLFRPAKER